MYHTNLFLRPAAFRLSPSGLERLVDCGRCGSLRCAFGTTHLVTLTDAMKASLITSELGRIDCMRSRSGAKSHDENCALSTRSKHHLIPTSRILHQLEIDGMSDLSSPLALDVSMPITRPSSPNSTTMCNQSRVGFLPSSPTFRPCPAPSAVCSSPWSDALRAIARCRFSMSTVLLTRALTVGLLHYASLSLASDLLYALAIAQGQTVVNMKRSGRYLTRT